MNDGPNRMMTVFLLETGAVLSEANKAIEEAKPLDAEQVRSGSNFPLLHWPKFSEAFLSEKVQERKNP